MNKSSSDKIEKQIEVGASISRVWRAITDYQEFGQWFRVNLEGPFVVGEVTRGQITYPGYEHVTMEVIHWFGLPNPVLTASLPIDVMKPFA